MLGQAQAIIADGPLPDLVLFSGIDNDIVSPARTSDYQAFGKD